MVSDAALVRYDGLEPMVAEECLVGSGLVEPLAFGNPAALLELKKGRGVPGGAIGQVEYGIGVEVDADQGQQLPRRPFSGPHDLIVPVGVFPADALQGIILGQRGEEASLQPFTLLAEQLAGPVEVDLLDDLPDWPPADQPEGDEADRKNPSPNDPPHCFGPGSPWNPSVSAQIDSKERQGTSASSAPFS